jgi:hypothetical protein
MASWRVMGFPAGPNSRWSFRVTGPLGGSKAVDKGESVHPSGHFRVSFEWV